MSVFAWRIATDTPDYTADDTTGNGAFGSGGRWNRIGTPMLYASGSIALACLETLVHLGAVDLPLNRYLVEIEIPDDVWSRTLAFDRAKNVGWDASPAGKASLDAGDQWIAARTSLLLTVPSAIVPEESNLLINPLHADLTRLLLRKVRRWTYDTRLRKTR